MGALVVPAAQDAVAVGPFHAAGAQQGALIGHMDRLGPEAPLGPLVEEALFSLHSCPAGDPHGLEQRPLLGAEVVLLFQPGLGLLQGVDAVALPLVGPGLDLPHPGPSAGAVFGPGVFQHPGGQQQQHLCGHGQMVVELQQDAQLCDGALFCPAAAPSPPAAPRKSEAGAESSAVMSSVV